MQLLDYELLVLKNASLEQNKEKKRTASASTLTDANNSIKALELKKRLYQQNEILNRQSLPLQQFYKNKVYDYFSKQMLFK